VGERQVRDVGRRQADRLELVLQGDFDLHVAELEVHSTLGRRQLVAQPGVPQQRALGMADDPARIDDLAGSAVVPQPNFAGGLCLISGASAPA
jgi:hypothetical protein